MKALIYGSRDFASTMQEVAEDCGLDCVGLIDDFNQGESIVGTLEQAAITHPPSGHCIVMAIGYRNLGARWAAIRKAKAIGYSIPQLIHPSAIVARSASLAEGVVVMRGAIVDSRATVGQCSVIWPGACVNHDARIDENCFISPGAVLCGHSIVGAHSFVGANACIVDRGVVPRSSRIKMQASYTTREA